MKEEKKKEGNLVGKVVPDNVKKIFWLAFIICQFLSLHVGDQVAMVSKQIGILANDAINIARHGAV